MTNSIRTHLAEFGIVAPVGGRGVEQLLEIVADPQRRSIEASALLREGETMFHYKFLIPMPSAIVGQTEMIPRPESYIT